MIVNAASEPDLRLVVNIYQDGEDPELAQFIAIIRTTEMQGAGRMRMQFDAAVRIFGQGIVGNGRCPSMFATRGSPLTIRHAFAVVPPISNESRSFSPSAAA